MREDLIHELKENYTVVIVTHNVTTARVSEMTGFFNIGGTGKRQLIEYDKPKNLLQPRPEADGDYHSRFG